MPDHRFPLQMECLTLAVQSMDDTAICEEHTTAILRRASAFLGWAQSTLPTKESATQKLRPHMANPLLGDPTESPVR